MDLSPMLNEVCVGTGEKDSGAALGFSPYSISSLAINGEITWEEQPR